MISIYDSRLTEFPTIGRILTPLECKITETAGGEYELIMVHPIDQQGRWQEIAVHNIIKAPVPKTRIPQTVLSVPATEVDRTVYKYYTTNKPTNVYKYPSDRVTLGSIGAGVKCEYAYAVEGDYVKVFTPYEDIGIGYLLVADTDYSEFVIESGSPTDATASVIGAHDLDDQCFRIYRTSVDSEGRTITAYARHVFYDLQYAQALYADYSIYGSSVLGVCYLLLNGRSSVDGTPTGYSGGNGKAFVASNITDKEYRENVSYTNIAQIMLDPDTGLVSAARCKIIRDNYMIYLVQNTEQENDKGFTVAYAKNLKSVRYSYDSDEAYTAVMPVVRGDFPFMCPDTPEFPKVYHNPYSDVSRQTYPFERVYILQVSDAENDVSGYQKMKDEALALFDDGIDLVSLTVDVDFINLGDTEEYKQYRDLQSVSLYDVVHISHAPLGFADKLQVKSYEWNAITKQYTRLTLGDVFDAEIKTIPAYQFRNGSVKISKLNKDDMERYIKKVVQS